MQRFAVYKILGFNFLKKTLENDVLFIF